MDKIYSRKRIRFFNKRITRGNSNKSKRKMVLDIIVVITIAISTACLIIKFITPVVDKNCTNIAKSIATKVSNEQASLVMSKYKYEDLCSITKNSSGNIEMINANVISINEIVSEVTLKIQEEMNKTKNSTFKIKLGTFTGVKVLSGRGPDIEIKMSTIGNIDTELKSEFIEKGINQTVHRIYLQVECNVVILTPFNTTEEKITNQVLLAEAVIIGTTPDTYYNFNGGDKEDMALETIQ